MVVLDATALVAAWAAATTADGDWGPTARLAGVVATAIPGWADDTATMGAWDGALLDVLAAAASGGRLEAVATCPACGLELDVTLAPPRGATAPDVAAPQETVTVALPAAAGSNAVTLEVRVPTLADLDAALAAAAGQPVAAIPWLVDRLVVVLAEGDGEDVAGHARTEVLARSDVLRAVDGALAVTAPGGLDPVELECPDCGQHWTDRVDLEAFVWAAVERGALRLLDEVHLLAGAFGWGHEEVLALPAAVRHHYLTRADRDHA